MQETAATMPEERKATTLEDVWAVIREVAEMQKANAAEIKANAAEIKANAAEMKANAAEMKEQWEATDKRMKEQWEATDRRIEEHRQATDKRMEEQWNKTNKKLGEFGLRLGDIVEHLIAPNLIEKFKALNFTFTTTGSNRKFYDSNTQQPLAEVDVLLENTKAVMAVEVKSKLQASHVWDHVKRLDKLRAYADAYDDRRIWLGAVGGAVLATDARQAAQQAGFYLIEQTGDTMKILAPEGFKPKEWTFGMTPPPRPASEPD